MIITRPTAEATTRAGLLAALLGVLALVGCSAPATQVAEQPPAISTPSATPTPSASPASTAPKGLRPLPAEQAINVTGLDIPRIGLSASKLEHLPLLADDTLGAPKDPDLAGWYSDGPVPGAVGPAVIAGHVDSTTGPAVFARLTELRRGDHVTVKLSDGRTVGFTVDRLVTAPKEKFPTDAVYGPTPDSQLRLITCDGPYDQRARSYVDNTVVFATADSTGPGGTS